MTRDETLRALEALGSAPAAKWIGSRLVDGGAVILQTCTRCGAEERLTMPPAAVVAYRSGARGSSLADRVPPDFDARLFAWKREFQAAHASCLEEGIS